MALAEFLDHGPPDEPLIFEQLPFNHPLFIMYSSGTTGPPKCMVHSAGVRRSYLFCHPDTGIAWRLRETSEFHVSSHFFANIGAVRQYCLRLGANSCYASANSRYASCC